MFKVPNMDGEFLSVGIDCSNDEVITKQYFKDECDINNILKNYSQTGQINHLNHSPGDYLDLPDALDLQSALSMVTEAQSAFSDLPSNVREAFRNDPVEFLAAVHDDSEANRKRFEELGLTHPRQAAAAAAPIEPAAKPSPVPASPVVADASGTGV